MQDFSQTKSLEVPAEVSTDSPENANQQILVRTSIIKHLPQIKDFEFKKSPILTLLDSVGWLFYKLIDVFFLLMKLANQQSKKEAIKGIEPPGPKGHFLVGLYPEFVSAESPLDFYDQLWKTYMLQTGICQYKLGHKTFYMISNPEYIKTIVNDTKTFTRGSPFAGIRYFLGNTIITAEGEAWQQKLQALSSHLLPKTVVKHHKLIIDISQTACEQWIKQGKFIPDLSAEMENITMQVISQILLHMDLHKEKEIGNTMKQMLLSSSFEVIMASMIISPKILDKLPIKFKQARKKLNIAVRKSIKKYIEEGKHTGDFYIDQLIRADQERLNQGVISQELIDDITIIFLAGYETTSKLLTWMIFELAQNPSVVQRLYEEIDSVLQGREPSIEDLQKLTYLAKVIQESLRFYSTTAINLREVTTDTQLGPYHIKKGGYSQVCINLLTKDPNLWKDPEEFNPDRFDNELTPQDQYFFLPFLAGKHRCKGQHLALLEAKIILVVLLQRFEFKISANQEPFKAIIRGAVEPDKPIQLVLTERQTFNHEAKISSACT